MKSKFDPNFQCERIHHISEYMPKLFWYARLAAHYHRTEALRLKGEAQKQAVRQAEEFEKIVCAMNSVDTVYTSAASA